MILFCCKTLPSAKCKSGTTVLLVHHPAPWSQWPPWSTLIHLGRQFPECGYTKWSKQDQGGPGVVQGLRQDHGAGWWTRSVQDHRGPLENFFLMYFGTKRMTRRIERQFDISKYGNVAGRHVPVAVSKSEQWIAFFKKFDYFALLD